MKPRSIVLFVVFLILSVPAASADDAEKGQPSAIAQAFFERVSGRSADAVSVELSDNPNCMAFNMSGGGFVIVSTVDAACPVIGYGLSGQLSPSTLAPAFKASLEHYVKPVRHASDKQSIRTRTVLPADVAPLLGDIAWAQSYPFNLLTPEVEGKHCPTGCVATAMAQMMRYYKYPERGTGQVAYLWNNDSLRVDLSQSTYDWSLMSAKYSIFPTGEAPTPEELSVATLMRDAGYAVHMTYGPQQSGGSHAVKTLMEHFGYDRGARHLFKHSVKEEVFKDIIRNETAQGRPVFFSSGAHYYLCDGYDSNGLFHFNYGWGGQGNGFFNVDAFSPDDTETSIEYGVQPDKGGKAVSTCASQRGFVWTGSSFYLNYDHTTYDEGLKSDFALAYRNVATRQVTYSPVAASVERNGSNRHVSLRDVTTLTDGTYEVFPVYRNETTEGWNEFYFADGVQCEVGLKIESDNRSYTNIAPEGKVYADNLVYAVSETEATASLVSYIKTDKVNGEIEIPSAIVYEGKTYPVTSIADMALKGYPSDSVRLLIGKNVETIGTSAFTYMNFESVAFAEGSRLKETGSNAFNNARISAPLILPEGLEKISWNSFGAILQLDTLDIPASVETIEGYGLSSPVIKHIFVHWDSPLQCNHKFEWFPEDSQVTLHVPAGRKSLYEATHPWNLAHEIVDDATTGIDEVLADHTAKGGVTVYNLNGIRLLDRADGSRLKELPAGIYIVNGRRILVR